jgi:hypothetical protein
MTRSTLKQTLRRSYRVLVLVLLLALGAKLADDVPGITGTSMEAFAKDVYEFLKDMALVFITVVAAYLASVFQRRHSFIEALREEWRDIIKAKSELFTFTQLEKPTQEQYLAAFCAISETIDNMRTVYGNVGETAKLIGLYPYAPLHDMRRALQSLEPRKNPAPSDQQRKLARDAILQSFYALRESFLEELDLESPDNPLLNSGGRRIKVSGAPRWARTRQERQTRHQDRAMPADPEIGPFLAELYEKEQSTAKPWRSIAAPTAAAAGAEANGRA